MKTLPSDLRSLIRPSSPNTALYAPDGVELACTKDADVPVYPKSPSELLAIARQTWVELKNVKLVEPTTHEHPYLHFIATTPLMRFKDDILVEAVDLEDGQASLIIYSASRLGYSDLGTNRKRVEDWLNRLNEAVRGA